MFSHVRKLSCAAVSLLCGGLLLAGGATAGEVGYVEDSQGAVYQDSAGECWQSSGTASPEALGKCGTCPDAPAAGCVVDAAGCAVDSDGDGVCDGLDKCPDSIKGCPVDANGCANDSDGDGVPDCIDKCRGSEGGVKVNKEGCEILEDVVLTAIGGPNFEHDRAELTPKAKAWLDEQIDGYKRAADRERIAEIRVIGHTDSTGTEEYNQALSERRAAAVARYLAENGIPERLIVVEGRGTSQAIASNATKAGRAQNRRVEIDVTSVGELENR